MKARERLDRIRGVCRNDKRRWEEALSEGDAVTADIALARNVRADVPDMERALREIQEYAEREADHDQMCNSGLILHIIERCLGELD